MRKYTEEELQVIQKVTELLSNPEDWLQAVLNKNKYVYSPKRQGVSGNPCVSSIRWVGIDTYYISVWEEVSINIAVSQGFGSGWKVRRKFIQAYRNLITSIQFKKNVLDALERSERKQKSLARLQEVLKTVKNPG